MLYVYGFRFYPKKEQVEFLNRQIGHCRFVYNKLFEIAKKDYEAEAKKWNYYEYKKLLPNILVDREIEPLPKTDRVVAIDVGLTHFCTLSTGEKVENPRNLLKTEERLKKLQRKLSRKVKGSNKYLKLQRKIAKLHEKVVNQRNDFLHKLSKRIIGDNQAVIVEDLNVRGLLKNSNLSKHIADAS